MGSFVVKPNDMPLMDISNEEELTRLGREWQSILGISDWVIKYILSDFNSDILHNECMGVCDFDCVNRAAIIYMARYDTLPKNTPLTICMENTLVHELMHIVYPITVDVDATYEEDYVYNEEHSKMEKMARALIKAKYRLTDDFYVNSEYMEKVGA